MKTLALPLRWNAPRAFVAAIALAGSGLAGCAAPVGPVEVTRFHVPAAPMLGRGVIRVVPAPGIAAESLEFRTYAAAVAQELSRYGYREAMPGERVPDAQVAILSIERSTYQPGEGRNPVSVGVGGSTGSYGSGLGIGLGIDLSGKPKPQVETLMRVMIREAPEGPTIWEGRANFAVSSSSPLAQTSLAAAKMAQALFKGFPGESGETILVK